MPLEMLTSDAQVEKILKPKFKVFNKFKGSSKSHFAIFNQ
jgi:hypothetical protein